MGLSVVCVSVYAYNMIVFCSGYPVSVSGVITVPVSASMYQTMVANIQHLQTNSDGTVCVTPVVQVPKVIFFVVNLQYFYFVQLTVSVNKQTCEHG